MDQAPYQAVLYPIHRFGAAELVRHCCSCPAATCRLLRLPPIGVTMGLHRWSRHRAAPRPALPCPDLMNSTGLTLGTVLLAVSGLFCLATLFFGTKGGYYDTDAYDGNGTAH